MNPSPTSCLLLRSWGLLPFKPQILAQPSGLLRITQHQFVKMTFEKSSFLQSLTRRPLQNIQNNDLKQGLTGSLGCSADLDFQILKKKICFLDKSSSWYILHYFFQPLQKNELYSDLGFKSSKCSTYMYRQQVLL